MTAPPPPKGTGPVTAQLLIDLAANPLDPGYAAAAERRGGAPAPHRWFDRAAVAIGCALVGFTLVVAYVHTHRSAPQTAIEQNKLVAKVRAEQKTVASLAASAQQLDSAVNKIGDQALGAGSNGDLKRTQLVAGEVAVTGPGLEVVLSEPPAPKTTAAGRAGTGSLSSSNILTDRDVRSVVNELWHDGAEAISVNNIRLTPTAAIRFAGQAVLVDFQAISSPYTIRAIGNADDLATSFASSEVASRYHTLVSADGIGFSFDSKSSLTLPAATSVAPSYARDANPTPSPR